MNSARQTWASAARVLVLASCALSSACQGNPTELPAGYAGQWNGTTSQGSIAFTVSADEKVTALTIGYSFNGCSGTQSFSNLNLDISPNVTCIPGPCPAGVQSFRGFGYASGPIEGPFTSVNGVFLSTTRAEGSVGFRDYPGCGSAIGIPWTATRR
jgi:hypothetical protein